MNPQQEPIKTQTNKILKKAVEINETIAKSGATHNEAIMFYDLVWQPLIEYTLAQSLLSDYQLQKAETKLMNLFYICRYSRNTTYKIQHALTKLGGAGLITIHASAGSGYILNLLKN